MYSLKDNGVIEEIVCGNNFGYVLSDNKSYISTDYKVLQSQTNGTFVPCMKMMYNGNIQLYYITDEYRPMSTMFMGITADILINIVVNMFESVVEVRNNGFLSTQNIDLSWDKIFVDSSTLKVKLVYLPVNVKVFDSYAEFQSELRSSIIKLINKVLEDTNEKMDQFISDLAKSTMTIEDIYNKYKGVGMMPFQSADTKNTTVTADKGNLKLVAMGAPGNFEIRLDRDRIMIGKKAGLVDEVIPFSKMISRQHCLITNKNGSYYISDEGSTNGTYVNRFKLTPHQPTVIKKGDVIRMADIDFRIV